MPDSTGKLTPQEIDKILAWFKAKFPQGVFCPMCKMAKTAITTTMSVPLTYDGKGVVALPPIVTPVISLSCGVCGHIMPFSAVQIGLIPVAPGG